MAPQYESYQASPTNEIATVQIIAAMPMMNKIVWEATAAKKGDRKNSRHITGTTALL
jgi:hypothetical protein